MPIQHTKPVERPFQELGDCLQAALKARGWTQKELARTLRVRPWTVNEYLRGKKRPSPIRVGEIAALLKLDPDRLAELSGQEVTEVMPGYEWNRLPWNTTQEFIESTYRLIDAAHALLDLGVPHKGFDLLNDGSIRFLTSLVEKERGPLRRELQALLVQIYNERLEFCSAIFPFNVIVSNMLPDFREVSRLAEAIGDTEASALASGWLADGYYIGRQSRKSIYWAMKSAAQSHNPRQLYIACRTLMLDAAYLGDRSSFLEAERATFALLEKVTRPTDRVTLWEAMGRARVVLGLPDAERRFSAGEQDYEIGRLNGDYKPVRLLQIIRGRLVALSKTSHPDQDYAEQLVRDGLLIARGGFDRHLRELGTLARALHLTERVQDVLPLAG